MLTSLCRVDVIVSMWISTQVCFLVVGNYVLVFIQFFVNQVNSQQVKEVIVNEIKSAYNSTNFVNNTFQKLLKLVNNSQRFSKPKQ